MSAQELKAKALRVIEKVEQDMDYPIHGNFGKLDLMARVRKEINDHVVNCMEDDSAAIGDLVSLDIHMDSLRIQLKDLA